ncbi:hypothetical protein ABT234_19205 [Streptomyces sp. NPDC001586]|uniref:hypothetical protein n=1 Tax=Streptomyces sp. NPDC001586 TaxID=3154387 RepID=UPI003328AEFF
MTTATNVTRVQDDYAQQIAGDLSANQAAQEQARTELQRLQQEIGQLEEGEKILLKMQEALGVPLKPTPTQATKPNAKTDATTGAKAGTKPGTPSGAKTATPAGTASGAKPGTPSGTASGAKPGTPSGAKTATPAGTTSGAKPEAKAGAKPGVASGAKPEAKAGAKPGVASGAKPEAKAGAKPGVASGAKAGVKSAAVPAARSAARGTKKAAEATAANAPRARKTTEGTETKKETGGPSWLDLVTATIAGQTEPRSAAEVTDALSTAHPERKVQATVIRNTLEQGVARGILERSKQGRSVYYTPTDSTTTPGTALPRPELP